MCGIINVDAVVGFQVVCVEGNGFVLPTNVTTSSDGK